MFTVLSIAEAFTLALATTLFALAVGIIFRDNSRFWKPM